MVANNVEAACIKRHEETVHTCVQAHGQYKKKSASQASEATAKICLGCDTPQSLQKATNMRLQVIFLQIPFAPTKV